MRQLQHTHTGVCARHAALIINIVEHVNSAWSGRDLVTSDGKQANSVTRCAAYDRTVNTMSSASFPPAAAMKHDGLTGPKPWMWHITSCYGWARRLSHLTLWKVGISLLVQPDELQLSELERGGEGTRAGWGRQREVCRPTAVWITGDSPRRCPIIDAPSTWASTSIPATTTTTGGRRRRDPRRCSTLRRSPGVRCLAEHAKSWARGIH